MLDLGLPPRPNLPDEGLAALAELLALDRLVKVIIISGQGEREVALRAVGSGAYDFLCKPVRHSELLDWLALRLSLTWLESPAPAAWTASARSTEHPSPES